MPAPCPLSAPYPQPDRYGAAVRARRAELRAARLALAGGHRAELRACLALSRLAAIADVDALLAEVRSEAAEHCAAADRAGRARLPGLLATAVPEVARAVHERWVAALRPALRRVATERGLDLDRHWPRLPPPRVPAPEAAAGGPSRNRRNGRRGAGSLLAGAVAGAALWRLALFPLAVLPVLGLPVLGLPAELAPLALGTGIALVVAAALARRAAAERALLRLVTEQVISAATAALRADLDRRLVEVERTAGAALDAAVLRRRAAVDAELALLAPDSDPDPARDPDARQYPVEAPRA